MRLDAIAAPLTLLAVALPFLFSYSHPPSSNFWPLVAAWACGAVLALVVVCRAWRLRRLPGAALAADGRVFVASQLAVGLLLAALLGGVVGLLQYFLGDPGLAPWVQPSEPGQAIGNLRQRNQQASLMSLGVWALLWLVVQMQARMGGASSSTLAAVYNAANEVAVDAFIQGKLTFPGIWRLVEAVMNDHSPADPRGELAPILEADQWARRRAAELIPSLSRPS